MRLSAIRVHNFGTFYGEHELDLRGIDAYAVAGKNGAGKSLFHVDAPLAALFGHTRSGRSLRNWVSRGEKEMEIGIVLDDAITIERAVRGGKGSLRVSGWEGAQVGDAQQAIVRLLGMDRDDWLSTYVFRQDDAQRLVTSGPAERKKLIQSWVCRDVWQRLYTHVASRLTEAKRTVSRLEGRLEALTGTPDVPDAATVAKAVKAAESAEKAAERAETKVPAPKPLKPLKALTKAEADAATARRDLRQAEANALEFDGNCPVTGSECPVAEDIRSQGDALEAVCTAAEKAAKSAQERLSRLQAAQRKKVDAQVTRIASARHSALSASRSARDLRREADRLTMAAQEAERVEAKRETALKELEESRRQVAVWTYLGRMLGRDGIPAAELEGAVGDAEDAANDVILQALGVDYRVEFSFGRELRQWREDCPYCGSQERKGRECVECGEPWHKKRSDDLDVMVRSADQLLPFDQESGGRCDGLSMALRLAFARRVGNWGTAICDEVFRSMDRPTQSAAASFLYGPDFLGLGYEQIISITHDAEMLAAAPRLLIVQQDEDRRSHLEWAR